MLVTYAGQWAFDEVLDRLREHLSYLWLGSVHHRGHEHYQYRPGKIHAHYKPLLFMSNGSYNPRGWFADSVAGLGAEKALHAWRQGCAEAEQCIQQITELRDLVVSPFLGSGTTVVATRMLRRRCVGCDVDEATARVARQRIAKALGSTRH